MNNMRISGCQKPNRAEKNKDIEYDVSFGRWVVENSMTPQHYENQAMIETNKRFVMANKQWDNSEDISNFLMDTTGQSTNRIKAEINYTQILMNAYVGSAERTSMRSSCRSFSPLIETRKEKQLNENLAWTQIAKNSDETFSNIVKSNYPIGDNELETAKKFENYYNDKFVESVNNLLKYTEVINNFDLMKKEAAESMCYSGMYVVEPVIMSGDYKFQWVQSEDFFWDRNAKKYDLSDAGFMGKKQWVLPTEIYERVQLLEDSILSIEAQNVKISNNVDRVPVYKSCWRDIEIKKWGYVKNEYDDIVFVKIDWKAEDEEKPKYKMSDVLDCKELNPYQLSVINKTKKSGKAFKMMNMEVWRYCEFVPAEYLTVDNRRKSNTADLVLGHGIMNYQENDIYSSFDMKPPFKVSLYLYINGLVNSPICVAINPQRIANRLMSAMENIINNEASSGTVIAEEAIEKSKYHDLKDITIRMKRGEPIAVPAVMLGGVQNAVGKYNDNSGNNKAHLMDLTQSLLQIIENTTGVNYAMKGQMDTPNQLVGTMQLMIQRGSVIQERFMASLKELFRQLYQSVATSGKRFYINERPKLVAITGDEGARVIELSKGMLLEEFRVSISFENDKQTERQFVDSTILSLLQYQLLDQKRATDLLGRGSQDDMWRSTREYAKEVAEAQKQIAEAQQQQQVQQQQMQQENFDKTLDIENKKIDSKAITELEKIKANNNNEVA